MKRRIMSWLLVFVMVLGMFPGTALADGGVIPDGAPFTAIATDAGAVGKIESKGSVTYTGYDSYINVPYYHVTVPAGATEVYVTHPASEDPFADASYGSAYGYYAEIESWSGSGMSFEFEAADDDYIITLPLSGMLDTDGDYTADTEGSFVADEEGNVGYAVGVERNDYSPICFFTFEFGAAAGGGEPACEHTATTTTYTQVTGTETHTGVVTCNSCEEQTGTVDAADCVDEGKDGKCDLCGGNVKLPTTEPTKPFLSIRIGDVEIVAGKIAYKGAFDLGDYAADEKQEKDDTYDYVHEDVPYYHVTVPLGTTYVSVTYSADTDIMNSGSDAYGYTTDLTIDAVSSATVRGTTFKGGYTKNSDDTQTVKFPVVDYQFNDEGVGKAITLEGSETPFPAVNLFTFEFENHTHAYEQVVKAPTCTAGGYTTNTCSCGHSYNSDATESFGGHNYVEDTTQYVAPTCAAAGTRVLICDRDGCGDTKTETVDKLAHTYGEGQVTKPATCKETGVKTYTCSVCKEGDEGHTKTETIAKLTTHSFNLENGEVDTTQKTCSVCGATNSGYVDNNMPTQDENGVYQIGTAEQLIAFAEFVNAGNKSVSAKLTADIDLTGKTWSGIGTYGNRFAGTFDGNGKTVTFDGHTAPLFLYAKGASNSNRAVIKNVTTAGTVTASAAIVGRAGEPAQDAWTTIQNCVNRAAVSGVAGIIGEARKNVTIDQCANLGNITGSKSTATGAGVGGIAGYAQNSVTISNCYNLGNITNTASEILVGGIVGNLYNGATVRNCYNAGEVRYAIAGSIYNKTGTVDNSYYLSTKSTEVAHANKMHANIKATAKTVAEITDAAMAAALGEAFQPSCPAPVFTWQTRAEHSLNANNECTVCGLGVKQTFAVTFVNGTGYTFEGESTVQEGDNYTFTVTISDGYEKAEDFAVMVGNDGIAANENGSYTVANVQGPLSISVKGVSKIPETYKVTLPGAGNGYRVNPCDGYEADSAERDGNYQFTVTFVDGFKAGKNFKVKANGKELVNQSGVYTITDTQYGIRADQTITVEGVDLIPYEDTARITITATQGADTFYTLGSTTMADLELEIPYFDLALYGLQKYYYNPYCYVDKDGKPVERQQAGNRETAYGVVTAMHAYIYITEVYALGLEKDMAGTGYAVEALNEWVSWTQPAGSSFMDLWGFGTNLNYYVNYQYPLGREEWGSTSDQIKLNDGDVLSVHMIAGQGSGSMFPFFVVNDTDQQFNFSGDQVDKTVVEQGTEVTLTLFRAFPTGQYTTGYGVLPNEQLYWIEDYNFDRDVDNWYKNNFAGVDGLLKTYDDGKITIDTAGLEPGTYYIATRGGYVDTPADYKPGSDGFTPSGYESGPALFRLEVTACSHNMQVTTAAVAPTCEDAGKTAVLTCANGCGKTEGGEEVAALGHNMQETAAAVAPTCEDAGKTAVLTCANNCGKTEGGEEVAALGHKWNAGMITKEPTYSEEGVKTYTCQNDQTHTKTEPVAKLDPPVIIPPVVPSQPGTPSKPTQSTETTVNPDGSTTKTETKADGSVTQTVTTTDGTVAKTETKVDGSSQTTVSTKDGSKSTTSTTASGVTTAQVTVSAAAAAEAAKAEKPVALPMPEVNAAGNPAAAPAVTVNTGAAAPVAVEIPVANMTAGTVAVLVSPDGTETIITDSIPTEDGVAVELADGATIKIVDNSTDFEDVGAADWEKDAVDFVSARGIMNGTSTTESIFSSDATTTRAQVWTMLARLSGVDTSKGENWYSAGQQWAVENGISDGTDHSGEITREQLATMLWRFMGEPASNQSINHFGDHHETSSWAVEANQWAVENGIIGGYNGKLNPTGDATRAQVAQMLMKMICNVK